MWCFPGNSRINIAKVLQEECSETHAKKWEGGQRVYWPFTFESHAPPRPPSSYTQWCLDKAQLGRIIIIIVITIIIMSFTTICNNGEGWMRMAQCL